MAEGASLNCSGKRVARGSEDGYAEEQTLDQILNQDAIPTESAQLQRAIEKRCLTSGPASWNAGSSH